MPFRERLKKTFSRSGSTGASETSSLSQQITNTSTIEGRKASHIYQPGEKMPPMKYRRPVQKEHKDRLEAFDFSKAWRRVSRHSIYSPHGSRMPSRNTSVVSGTDMSRDGSVVSTGGAPRRSVHRAASVEASLPEGRSNAGSSDVTNGQKPLAVGEQHAPSASTGTSSAMGAKPVLPAPSEQNSLLPSIQSGDFAYPRPNNSSGAAASRP